MFQWNRLPSLFDRPLFESSWSYFPCGSFINHACMRTPAIFSASPTRVMVKGRQYWAKVDELFDSLHDAFGASHMALVVKNTPAKAGDIRDADSICWVGKIPWRSTWQYSYLENPMNRGAWQVAVNGLKKSQTRLKRLAHTMYAFPTLLLFSHSVVSHSLQPHGQQHARLPCPSPSPGVCSNLCPLSQWCHPTISSSVIPCSSCLRSFPASGSFPMSRLFPSSRRRLELQLQHQSFQWVFRTDFLYNWLVWSPCCPRDSQESFPTPRFKSIISLVLSLFYHLTLRFIHDYWKNHSFD